MYTPACTTSSTLFSRAGAGGGQGDLGSDWPGMPHIGRNIEMIRKLPLKDETKEKILGGNAARILELGNL